MRGPGEFRVHRLPMDSAGAFGIFLDCTSVRKSCQQEIATANDAEGVLHTGLTA